MGKKKTNLIGDLARYPDPVYFDPEGMATILSLSNVKKHHRVTYDSKGDLARYSDPVYFDPEGTANILSLSNVKNTNVSRMTMKEIWQDTQTQSTSILRGWQLSCHCLT